MSHDGNIVIGVDIGGTKVAAGLVDSCGEILKQNRTHMIASGEPASGLAAVSEAIRGLLSGEPPQTQRARIGVCAPGPLNPLTGVIINPPNLPIWRNYPLAEEMQRLFHVEIKVDNDANAAALAEAKWGAGRGYQNVFYTCIGTGIGTGIVFDGKIYHGRTGAAGEGGHLGIDMHGPKCNCGKRGCIETLAAGPAIARRARQKLAANKEFLMLKIAGGNAHAVNGEIVGKALDAGDPLAKEVMDETLDLLAYWLGNIIDVLDPDVIIVGGGVSTLLAPYLSEIRRRFHCAHPSPQDTPLVLARYGEDAGIAGAAALFETQ